MGELDKIAISCRLVNQVPGSQKHNEKQFVGVANLEY